MRKKGTERENSGFGDDTSSLFTFAQFDNNEYLCALE